MKYGRVLLTGSTGFLGRHVKKALLAKDCTVVSLNRRPSQNCDEIQLDFDDLTVLKNLSPLSACDAIIHLASHVDFSRDVEISKFFPTNIFGTSLLTWLAQRWNSRFILVSGTIVYGARSLTTRKVDTSPSLPYGEAKYLAEQIVEASGIDHAIIRSVGIFGYRGPHHLTLNQTIDRAVDQHDVPVVYGAGRARRNYIYVEDLANTIVECLDNDIDGIHIASGRDILTIAAMVRNICDVFLPGCEPRWSAGNDGSDVVFEHSKSLPQGRTFREALFHIQSAVGDLIRNE